MTTQPNDPPEYDIPQPGEKDSLDLIFQAIENMTVRLTYEAMLHLEMYPDFLFANDLGARIANARHGIQALEDQFWPRVGQVCE